MKIDDRGGRALFLTAGLTSARRGEILGLRWSDLDFANGRIWLRRSIGLRGEVKTPKTRKSIRAVGMPKPLRDALEAWWKESSFREPEDFFFASPTEAPLDGSAMDSKIYKPARKRAGLPPVRFHDLRHTCASILIEQGEHPKVISEQLGHASIAITMDRYGHLFDSARAKVSDSLERAWAEAETASETASALQADGLHTDAAALRLAAGAAEEIPASAAE